MENVTLAYEQPTVTLRMRRLGWGAVVLAAMMALEAAWHGIQQYWLMDYIMGLLHDPSLAKLLIFDIPDIVFCCMVPVAVWALRGVIVPRKLGKAEWKKVACVLAAVAYAVLSLSHAFVADASLVERESTAASVLWHISSMLSLACEVLWVVLRLAALWFMLRVCALARWRKMGLVSAWALGFWALLAVCELGEMTCQIVLGYTILHGRFVAEHVTLIIEWAGRIAVGLPALECVYWAVIAAMALAAEREMRAA